MKPNFTLSLSFDGIRLLHRVADGWRLVGEVMLDSADLAAELAVLRKTATSLEPGGLRSLLLIPDSQIRYLTLDTPDMDPAARRAAAAKALEGATPYAVDELVFHVSPDGARSHVAAVARETLDEAEAFAVEHRFYPVGFVAAPSDHSYRGVPDFGLTTAAQSLLAPGETLEPETAPVVALPTTPAPKGPIAETPEPATEETQTPLPDATGPANVEETAQAEPSPVLAETPADPPPPRDEPLPEFSAPVEPPAEADPAPVQSTAPRIEDLPKPEAPPRDQQKPGSVAASAAPLAAAAATEGAKPPSRKIDFSAPPANGATSAGFASRRAPEPQPSNAKASAKAPSLGGARRDTAPAGDSKASPTPAAGAASGTASTPLAAATAAAASPAHMPLDATEGTTETATPQPDSSSLTAPNRSTGGTFLSRRKAKDKKPRKERRLTPAAMAAPTPASEAERMTIFGARQRTSVGGKPRFLGLILTAALLLFLAAVAAWASIFLDNGSALSRLFGDRSPRSTAEAMDQAPIDSPAPDVAEPVTPLDEARDLLPPEPEGLNAIETAALDAGLTDEDGAVLDALRTPQLRPSSDMTEAEIDARYATTGIWPRAPQVPPAPAAEIDIDDLYLTSIDPISSTTDAVALPAVDRFATDTAPGAVATPAAAGTTFDLDARGLVTPTAKGALSPDGHLVYLGKPDVVPPQTLAKREVVPEASAVDSGLIERRPHARPEDLAETNERAQLGGLTRAELAGLRPQLRPQSAQEAAAEEAAAKEDATEEVAALAPSSDPTVAPTDTNNAVAAALATPPAIENATKQATKLSRRPDTRPRNFSRIVKRAETAAAPAQVASVAPRTVAPKIPSKTSVAKQATSKNAINLRKMNLIGVYGKPSNRRALVRLSNGRYQKVEVGDRVDGGRVAAIGDSELRYVKRGRNVVLRMPN
ncbi:hypothetical protein HTT03_05635 [Sulfitobacter sp. S0837]|uniref:hypothetical protein n=1 Tax=Sulfitobacter maritimus TaxID=2741719 RepID=UPI00158172D4|nr:hypothetical protein [Sulfitobacter maritimus]NUH64782.1 hypothetical protein [Sulfitobacter maritimus]